jgi:glycosyltransferase involved in cell wall biosynthesis
VRIGLRVNAMEIVSTIIKAFIIIISLSIVAIFLYGIKNIVKSMKSFINIEKYDGKKSKVSIVIPARNEEKNLEDMLFSMTRIKNEIIDKIILVNDRSTDLTEEIIKKYMNLDKRIELISISNLPKSWFPKPYALYLATRKVPIGDVILFLDADVKGDYDKIVDISSRTKEGQIISFVPYFYCNKFYCYTSQSLLSALMVGYFGYNRTINKNDRFGLLFGCCFSIRPYTYNEIGSHASVKKELVEDKQLATNAKSKNVRILYVDSRKFIYTKSWDNYYSIKNLLSRLFYDYAKNIKSISFYLLFIGLLLLFYFPYIFIPLLIFKQLFLSVIVLISFFIENIFIYIGGLTNNIRKPYSLLYFISAYILLIALLESKYRGVVWKGTSYKL